MNAAHALLTLTLLVGLPAASPEAWLALAQSAQESPLRARLTGLLPAPGQTAQVMQVRSSLSVVQLRQRVMQEGGDLRVLADIVEQSKAGAVPSYNVRLNISQAEFQRYIVFQDVLETSGHSLKLSLSRDAARLMFGDAPGASGLKGLAIDLGSGELSTPDGFTARPQAVQVSASQDVNGLGARGGLSWDLKGSNPRTQNALQAHLALLQLAGGQILLSYNRVSIQRGRISEDSLNLMYRK